MAIYTLIKYKDIYTLTNTDVLLAPFRFTLSKKECLTTTIVKDVILQPGKSVDLFESLIDGQYELFIFEANTLLVINYYFNLNLDIITNTEKVVCGCKDCNDCEDCADCDLYLSTITTMLAFYYLNAPMYNDNLDAVTISMNCNTDEKIFCYLSKQMVTGNRDTKRLFLQMVGMYYLAFYYTDLQNATDGDEEIYINTKYKSSKILKCLANMGMIITPPVQQVLVYFWQLDNINDDINDIIPIFGVSYLSDKNYLPLETFEQGYIVNYIDVGRIAFAVRKVESSTFIITDALNNDITDAFEMNYFSNSKSWLFVSKLVYANSDVYFKFKELPV